LEILLLDPLERLGAMVALQIVRLKSQEQQANPLLENVENRPGNKILVIDWQHDIDRLRVTPQEVE
jgi:hypothetical protein